AGAMLERMAGVDMVHVPYKGTGPALVGLLGGQIDFVFADTSALPHVEAGKLRALAVSGPKRLSVLPDVPTVDEAGLKGFSVTSWYSIMAPAGTPPDVIKRLNEALAKGLQTPEIQARIRAVAGEPAQDTSAQYLEQTLRSDLA